MTQGRKVGYALTRDGYHIAYADLGHGGVPHLFIAHGASLVEEVQRQHPAHIRFERFLASLGRLLLIDPRGIGVSDVDPRESCFTPETGAEDIVAVLDAAGIERIVVSGEGFAGHAAVRFAVTHPERTLRLALHNSYARLTRADDYAIGVVSTDQIAVAALLVESRWGTGETTAAAAPALMSDASFREYFAARERQTAGPRTIAAYVRAMLSSDVRELLPLVSVPTLVHYTGDLAQISAEHSRYLARHIPNSILVEAPGSSFYQPTDSGHLSTWAEFVVGGPAALGYEKKLLAMLFTDIVGSTKQAAELGDARWARIVGDLDTYVSQRARFHRGRVIKQTGDGHLVAFDLPGDALLAAREIALGVHVLGVDVRCGVHIGEVELLPDGDVRGVAVHTAARICDAADRHQVLVSRSVADLAAGSEFRFEERGDYSLSGVPGSWTLYEVVK